MSSADLRSKFRCNDGLEVSLSKLRPMNLSKPSIDITRSLTLDYLDALDHIWRGMGWQGDSPTEPLYWMDELLTQLAVTGSGRAAEAAETIRAGLGVDQLPAWLRPLIQRIAEYGVAMRVLDGEDDASQSLPVATSRRNLH